jgi:hypothetical protein
MDNPSPRKNGKRIQYLRHENPHEIRAKSGKAGLFDQLVQIERQHFKRNAQVRLVHKRILHSSNVMLVVRIMLVIEHVEDCDFDKRLVVIRGFVFDHFDRDEFFSFEILALISNCTWHFTTWPNVPWPRTSII